MHNTKPIQNKQTHSCFQVVTHCLVRWMVREEVNPNPNHHKPSQEPTSFSYLTELKIQRQMQSLSEHWHNNNPTEESQAPTWDLAPGVMGLLKLFRSQMYISESLAPEAIRLLWCGGNTHVFVKAGRMWWDLNWSVRLSSTWKRL